LARLNPLPYREVKRRLERAGFSIAGQRGSHVKFARTRGDVTDVVVVPHASEIPVGTLRSILAQAHCSLQEWENLG
jgi:predicted RNA binding protein YcfA (HicA-like mRNA interferase family)